MFKRKAKINTNPKEIDDILDRSIKTIYPNKEKLKEALLSGKLLRIYVGADATGPDLHLGHSTNFILLEKFRQLGHETIVLFGDFTAQIGDPTDKSSARVRLSKKEVEKNMSSWKKQISKIVSFSGSNPVKIEKNGSWLRKLSFEDLIDLSSNFTVQQMIERDMFSERIKNNKPIYLHEFFYPLMQGYDSTVLDVDLEIGGNDQTFNMLAGRTLQRKINDKEKFVISTTLLENPKTGKKLMSKSEGGYISLQDNAENMFGKVMALPDEVVIQMFIDTTFVSREKISQIEADLKSGSLNPRDAKIFLAKELIKIYHSEKDANTAEENFINTFSKKETPKDILEIKANAGEKLVDVLLRDKIIESKSDFYRLVQQGGVENLISSQKISDQNIIVENGMTLKIGKRRFVKIVV